MDSFSQPTTYLRNQYKLAIEQATFAAQKLSQTKYRIASVEFENHLRKMRGYLRYYNKVCKGTIFNGVLKLLTHNSRLPPPPYQKTCDLYRAIKNNNDYQQKMTFPPLSRISMICSMQPNKKEKETATS